MFKIVAGLSMAAVTGLTLASPSTTSDVRLGEPVVGGLSSQANAKNLGPFTSDDYAAAREVTPSRIGAVLSGLTPDRVSTRGVAEARIYAGAAAGVVLIATNDGLGSGSVVNSSGLIVTNLHVVGKNTLVAVVYKPSVEGAAIGKPDVHTGVVVRRDEVTDLALVQVADPPVGTKVIPLASLSDITVGSDVHAIGHPTGEAWTYTKGIVSQIRRDYKWSSEDGVPHDANVIQTQTPINPGNSGGPLLTARGALVGVNSFKAAGEALNFAVSVDDVRRVLAASEDRFVRVSAKRAGSGDCSIKSYGVTRLKDGSGTRELFDLDCFGKPDAMLDTPDDPKEPITLSVDPDHVGRVTGVLVSLTRNGKWDASLWDTTGTGKPTLKCVHADGSMKPTRCEKYDG